MPSTEISPLSEGEETFLRRYLPESRHLNSPKSSSLPFVTLTYACSLDGMISFGSGVRTPLSGRESKSMTHYLRLKHDAILVGAGTAVADKPSLNCRYPGAGLTEQPRPVVVDPRNLWTPAGSAVSKLAEKGKGLEPWLIAPDRYPVEGARLIKCEERRASGYMGWEDIFETLKAEGIDSVMVEGGAAVIRSLLQRPHLVDSVIVTLAPTWLGEGLAGSTAVTHVNYQRVSTASLSDPKWHQFGVDGVVCGILEGPGTPNDSVV